MSGKKRSPSADELALWRLVTARVKPLARRHDKLPIQRAQEAFDSCEGQAQALEWRVKPQPIHERRASSAEPSARRAPLADRSNETPVRRGRVEIEAVLDLHGRTQQAARAALARFLAEARAGGLRVVKVITGKGAGGEGPIRRALPLWLEAHDLKALVSGFAQAHRRHGGEGAYYLFLRRA